MRKRAKKGVYAVTQTGGKDVPFVLTRKGAACALCPNCGRGACPCFRAGAESVRPMTPEERRVVEAAVDWKHPSSIVGSFEAGVLSRTIDKLLTARAKAKKEKPCPPR